MITSPSPLAATVDLFYEVANKDGALRTGERVGVNLPLKGDEESLTVPRAALVRDIFGGTWVFEKTGDTKAVVDWIMAETMRGI